MIKFQRDAESQEEVETRKRVSNQSLCVVFAVQGHSDAVGGAEEDQRVLLVLGGHVALH